MAIFDAAQQRMCVRVVYDGAASAGKTTNLIQLAELFATQRVCELFSPAEIEGRTLYFDWLQIAAGMVCGFPLVCQVITVPGQLALTPRRRHLLTTADVVVHVVDSADDAVERSSEALALFDEVERERGAAIPLVIQANKQDQLGAISGATLQSALAWRGAQVVEAIASDAIGVIDTFVTAVRAVGRAVQASVERGDVRVPVCSAETVDIALERLELEEIDPEAAAEIFLEQASNAVVFGEALLEARAEEPESSAAPPAGGAFGPILATFPTEDIPTGFVWPAHTGRRALRMLASDPRLRSPAPLDARGAVRVISGDLVLATREDRRFGSSEVARQALVQAARACTQLGVLLLPETVLVAQPTDDATWLWTISPSAPTIADQLSAPASGESAAFVLEEYGAALARALRVHATQGLKLDLHPQSFALWQDKARYVGEIGSSARAAHDVLRSLLAGLEAVGALGGEVDRVVAAIEVELRSGPGPTELGDLFRGPLLELTSPFGEIVRDMCARLGAGARPNGEAA